jgi:hypoxanthine phosphoribosyltransferase
MWLGFFGQATVAFSIPLETLKGGRETMDKLNPDLARILVSEEVIQRRVKEMAEQICQDYANVDQLYIIGVLKGAFMFMSDLTKQIHIPHIVDFMAVTSYGKTTTSGEVRILMDLREPVNGRHVLIVEDILDSGLTLSYLYNSLLWRKPASLKTIVLCRKKRARLEVPIDYLGFEIPDVWVVGYGLDFADTHRTWPFIAELKEEVYQ